MKYLGIDYGEIHLGLAVSEEVLVEPYRKCKNQNAKIKNTNQKLKIIKEIVKNERIEEIVIGVSGGKMAKKTKIFGEELKKITGLPVEYVDETLTSQEAVKKMIESGRGRKFRQEEGHNIAACIILQSYLDSRL